MLLGVTQSGQARGVDDGCVALQGAGGSALGGEVKTPAKERAAKRLFVLGRYDGIMQRLPHG